MYPSSYIFKALIFDLGVFFPLEFVIYLTDRKVVQPSKKKMILNDEKDDLNIFAVIQQYNQQLVHRLVVVKKVNMDLECHQINQDEARYLLKIQLINGNNIV